MPFTFSPPRPSMHGLYSRPQIPLGEYLGVAMEQGVHDSMLSSIGNLEEQSLYRTGNMLDPEDANKKYGLPTLNFDEPIYESEAKLLNERKQAELRRMYYLTHGAPDGILSARGLAGIGAGFIGSIMNPLDFAVNFLPIVGSTAAAARAQALGRGALRQGIARGLLTTEEALAKTVPGAPRLTSSLIQGFTGNFVAEIPHLASALESKENYTPLDSMINITAGTVLSGALHLAVTSAARAFQMASNATKEAATRKAVNDFLEGKSPEVHELVKLDENIIRAAVKFDIDAARASAIKTLDIEDVKSGIRMKYGEAVTAAAVRSPDGKETLTGPAHALIGGYSDRVLEGWQHGFVTSSGRFIDMNEAGIISGLKGAAGSEDFDWSSSHDQKPYDAESLAVFEEAKMYGLEDHDAWNEVRKYRREEADRRLFERKDVQKAFEEEKERRIQAFVESERTKYDEQGKFERARATEIQRQIAAGKTLTPEQIKEWKFTEDRDKAAATLKEQSTTLQQEIKDLENEIKSMTPEELEASGHVDKLLDYVEQLDEIKKQTKANLDAIEKATNCLTIHVI
jgi:hypothetical protein